MLLDVYSRNLSKLTRRALINDLTYRYKKCTYQDASFQEYGYGATMVTINS